MSEHGDNVWADLEEIGEGVRGVRLRRTPGRPLAAAVWELEPGSAGVPYHFHHGTEELLVVLRGRPLLRGPDGERELAEGEVVHFPPGPDGAHSLSNPTAELVRYLMVGAHASPDVVEYPDEGAFAAFARTASQRGTPFSVRLPLPPEA
ncbi:MAG TPA: cupin domain-containing protein [Gaiellaceae bacterium]|nr:cupin domain-containing protein [Gaiellaceae bacterium]